MSNLADAELATFEAVLLLYLACAKLTDGDLDPREAETIVTRARAQVPELAPSYADKVLATVAVEFAQLPDIDTRLRRVVLAAERVAEGLSDEAQRAVIEDLIEIADADGETSSAERDFVLAAAKTFGIEIEAGES